MSLDCLAGSMLVRMETTTPHRLDVPCCVLSRILLGLVGNALAPGGKSAGSAISSSRWEAPRHSMPALRVPVRSRHRGNVVLSPGFMSSHVALFLPRMRARVPGIAARAYRRVGESSTRVPVAPLSRGLAYLHESDPVRSSWVRTSRSRYAALSPRPSPSNSTRPCGATRRLSMNKQQGDGEMQYSNAPVLHRIAAAGLGDPSAHNSAKRCSSRRAVTLADAASANPIASNSKPVTSPLNPTAPSSSSIAGVLFHFNPEGRRPPMPPGTRALNHPFNATWCDEYPTVFSPSRTFAFDSVE
ncbi:unnamed protein product [Diplocarpon coronariae]|nr:hypothetical protein JHW43_001613 [Diplocarpon mali]